MNTSIRRNILVILLIAQGLLTAGCVTLLVFSINLERNKVFDAVIQRRVSALMAMIQVDDADSTRLDFTSQQDSLSPGDLFVIRLSSGKIIGESPHAMGIARRTSSADTKGFSLTISGQKYRGKLLQAIPVVDQDEQRLNMKPPRVDIVYARPVATFDAMTRRITLLGLLGSIFWITSSCIIAWFSVTRGMKPLGELAVQASSITERNWTLSLSSQVRQVSELRPLTQALEALLLRLSLAFERERAFVNDAAHELKTAVTIQKSSLQVAIQGSENTIDYRSGLERALEDVDRLDILVHRMLSLASIENSDHCKIDIPVALDETILEACDQLRPVAISHRTMLDVQVATACYIASEEGLLQTLWVTLIENAIRYNVANLPIIVSTTLQRGSCTVSVRDHGMGIAPEYLPHLFERFYRADPSRARNTGGVGLGLAIAKAIVERHNGQIEIESERGRGTTVRVTLPYTKAPVWHEFSAG